MNVRGWIGCCSVAALLVVALLWWPASAAAPVPPSGPGASDPREAPVAPAASFRVEPPAAANEPLERAPAAGVPTCVVQGLCRTIDGAASAAGFEVSLSLLVDGMAIPCARATSPANERFVLQVPWQPNSALLVTIGAQGFVQRRNVLPAIGRDEVRDLGEITVPIGAVVTGRVRDQAGRPAPGLMFTLDAVQAVPIDAFGALGLNRAVLATGADGTFTIEGGLRRGTWKVRPGGSGVRSSSPERFEVDAESVHVELTVSLGPTIEGLVVDAEGRGVPRMQLEAVSLGAEQRQSLLPCMTDAGGVFQLRGGAEAVLGENVQVRLIPGADRGRWLLEEPAPVAWGSHGHTLVVGCAPLLDLQVLDAHTGHPIEDYAVSCETGPAVVWRHPGRHPGGKVGIEAAGRGPWSLSVLAADLDVPILLHRPVTAAEATRPLVVSIERRPPVVVEVRSAEGPVAGATVQLCGLGGEAEPELLASARALDAPRNLFQYHGAGPVRFGQAVTGEDGLAMLREPPQWSFATWLRIESPGRCVRVQRRLSAESGRIVVQLDADAVVTGRVVPVPTDERGLRVVACPGSEPGDGNPGPVAEVAELQADGSFTLPVAPGPQRLWLLRQGGAARPLGAGELRVAPGQRLELGELRLE